MSCDKRISIRITEDDATKIKYLTTEHDINISSLIRRTIRNTYDSIGDDECLKD